MTKPLIYIAGPYTSPDAVLNTHKAVKAALSLRDAADCAVLIPHVTLLAHAIDPRDIDYWYSFDIDQMEHCDAVWRLDGPSTGADREVDHAFAMGMPVFLEREREVLIHDIKTGALS
jgi:nucleoside 2-deoxyribosyltransferase